MTPIAPHITAFLRERLTEEHTRAAYAYAFQLLFTFASRRLGVAPSNTLQATGDIRKVSLWLGHAHQSTTEIYLQADPTEKIASHRVVRAPPIAPGTLPAIRPSHRVAHARQDTAAARSWVTTALNIMRSQRRANPQHTTSAMPNSA